MHFCMDEVRCLLAVVPEIRMLLDRLFAWWNARRGHHCSLDHEHGTAVTITLPIPPSPPRFRIYRTTTESDWTA